MGTFKTEVYRDLTLIKIMFIERIQPIFANAEKEANDYRDELWNEKCFR